MGRRYCLVIVTSLLTAAVGCNLSDSAVAPIDNPSTRDASDTVALGDADAVSDAAGDVRHASDVDSADSAQDSDAAGVDATSQDVGPNDVGPNDAGPGDTAVDTQSCPTHQQRCGSECVDTSTDEQHCAACDHPCVAPEHAVVNACESSRCVFACDLGWFDLNEDLQADGSDGCEADCKPTNDGVELCIDGVDNDCNGAVDDGCDCNSGETFSCGIDIGECDSGVITCEDGQLSACKNAVEASPEVCDGLDNDCNGQTDDNPTDVGGPCDTGRDGVCADGTRICDSDGRISCESDTPSSSEICDGLDDDCDGQTDEGVKTTYYKDADDDGYGTSASITACGPSGDFTATAKGDCDDDAGNIHPGATQFCSGNIDNDCDGKSGCADSDCDGRSCLSTQGGGICRGGVCVSTSSCTTIICRLGEHCICGGTQCCPDGQSCLCR